jgi:hypothetical protein
MKNTKLLIVLFFLPLINFQGLFAQSNMLEKDYEISRKAKKGYLGNIESKENGDFDMIYILPSSKRKIKTEIYHFDKDANLTGTDKDEMEIEKAKTKWKWFNYKGDFFISNNISVSANMVGDFVLRKKRIYGKYNWWTGQYERRVKLLDKVKPKNDNGKKYKFLGGVYEVERDSSIIAMALNWGDPKDKLYSSYDLLKSDNELNVTVLEKVQFEHGMQCVFSQPLSDDLSESIENDDMPRDLILIYAPTNINKSNAASDPHAYEYLRITPEGKIIERVKFMAPTVGWRIIDAYEVEDRILLYGMGSGKENKFVNQIFKTGLVATTSNDAAEQSQANTSTNAFAKLGNTIGGKDEIGLTQEAIDAQLDLLKYNSFVFTVLRSGNATSKITEIDEVNKKTTCPPDMKKPLKFDGNMFKVSSVSFLSDKSVMLSIQDFKKNNSKNKPQGNVWDFSTTKFGNAIYKGMYLLHFSPEGELIKNYTVEIDQKNKKGFFNHSPLTSDMIPAKSYVYENGDKTKLNWTLHIVKAIEKSSESSYDPFSGTTTTTTYYDPLYSIEYGTIDLQKKTASDFKTLGEDEKRKYYLYPSHNVLSTPEYLYFFSETVRGDKMLISRMGKN